MGKASPWAQNPREKAEGEEFPAWQASSVMAWPMKGELPPVVGPPKECVGKYINIEEPGRTSRATIRLVSHGSFSIPQPHLHSGSTSLVLRCGRPSTACVFITPLPATARGMARRHGGG